MAEKWIQKAISRPGALTAAAKSAGKVKGGTINKAWIEQQTHSSNPRRAAQARLAQRLAQMRRGK